MNWALIGLKLLGVGKSIGTWLSKRSLAELAFMAVAVFAIIQHFQLADARHDRDGWKKNAASCAAARKADRKSYEDAQAEAARHNREDVARKEAEYRRNNDEAVSNLNARIERLRRELRADPSAPQGSAGGSGSPQAHDPQRAPGAAGLCLAPEELLRAAENEERHDQLITLIRKQLGLDP